MLKGLFFWKQIFWIRAIFVTISSLYWKWVVYSNIFRQHPTLKVLVWCLNLEFFKFSFGRLGFHSIFVGYVRRLYFVSVYGNGQLIVVSFLCHDMGHYSNLEEWKDPNLKDVKFWPERSFDIYSSRCLPLFFCLSRKFEFWSRSWCASKGTQMWQKLSESSHSEAIKNDSFSSVLDCSEPAAALIRVDFLGSK